MPERWDTSTLNICEDETASAQHDASNLIFDGNDVLGYVVHDASGNALGNIFLTGSTPDFNYDPILNFETTYYISAVVANDDGNGFPVLDSNLDPCISVTPGQPVIFSQTPIVSIIGDNTICQGTSTDITFNIIGAGPFDFQYSTDGVNTNQLNGILDGHTIQVSPNQSTNYEFVSIVMTNSPGCVGNVDPANDMASVTVIEVPAINNFEINCSSMSNEFEVTFEISGGNASNYSVLGSPGTLVGNVFTSDIMPGGTTYSFQVDDGSGCLSELISAIEYCSCTPDISPAISLIEPISCFGESDGILAVTNLNGQAPFNFIWNNGISGTQNSNLSAGNYSVTMTDANNCLSVASITLDEPTAINAELAVEDPTCYGEDDGSITFENVTGGSGDYDFSLNVLTPYTGNLYYDLAGGTYEAIVIDSEGCEWSNEVVLLEPEQFTLDLGTNQLIDFGDSVQIIPQISSPVSAFYWSSSSNALCDSCLNQTVAPLENTTYTLSVVNSQGCEVRDELTINVSNNRPVYFPSAFTPNGDGFNDYFKAYGGPAVNQIKVFRIFNRWGALIYEVSNVDSSDDGFGWDGTHRGEFVENAVYIYYAEIEFKDGKTVMFKGDVTVIR